MNELNYKNRNIKKAYIKPNIQHISIDNEISLVLNSFAPDPDEPGYSDNQLNNKHNAFKA